MSGEQGYQMDRWGIRYIDGCTKGVDRGIKWIGGVLDEW